MKIKSPITFRNKDGSITLQGDPVEASAVKGFQTVTDPEPYETKVVREVAADAPRAVTTENIVAPAKVAKVTKAPAKAAPRKTAKKK